MRFVVKTHMYSTTLNIFSQLSIKNILIGINFEAEMSIVQHLRFILKAKYQQYND